MSPVRIRDVYQRNKCFTEIRKANFKSFTKPIWNNNVSTVDPIHNNGVWSFRVLFVKRQNPIFKHSMSANAIPKHILLKCVLKYHINIKMQANTIKNGNKYFVGIPSTLFDEFITIADVDSKLANENIMPAENLNSW